MATDQLAEGIRKFSRDLVTLEEFVRAKIEPGSAKTHVECAKARVESTQAQVDPNMKSQSF